MYFCMSRSLLNVLMRVLAFRESGSMMIDEAHCIEATEILQQSAALPQTGEFVASNKMAAIILTLQST